MEATAHFFGLWASSYKGWHIIKARIGLFSISQGCLFHYHMFLLLYLAFLSSFFFILFFICTAQILFCNLLPCSSATKSDPGRIRENFLCFLSPSHRLCLSIFALDTGGWAVFYLAFFFSLWQGTTKFSEIWTPDPLLGSVQWNVRNCDLQFEFMIPNEGSVVRAAQNPFFFFFSQPAAVDLPKSHCLRIFWLSRLPRDQKHPVDKAYQ